jgi:hypothetical protein
MKAGQLVRVAGGACHGMAGYVVRPNGASTLVRFTQPVQKRNGMWSEEVWLATRQLEAVLGEMAQA